MVAAGHMLRKMAAEANTRVADPAPAANDAVQAEVALLS
jgi:hypothetical protein